MKKICIIVMIALTLVVTGCGNKNNENKKNLNNKNASNVTEKENGKDKETEEEEKKDEASDSKEEIINVLKIGVDQKENDGFFKYNLNLSFNENGTYKYTELKDSVEVTEEDGYKFEGDFYSNKYGAIDTVLRFNEQWLKYVNDGNADVYGNILNDSEAYEDIKNFNRNGLTEKFKTLEIGEVRKHNDYYYVWTHEVIEELRSGKTTLREYNWIYKFKKIEMDFWLVDFTRDMN
ncbi:TcaA NTF2-like domain-containing protein [Oceanirhabdus seepicola]|uniref:TcaA protein NTF2-like domain-containing protein n=1 Tax=Oceanirhabdus seepicola TaxID=2828781 RepID=A0A9J6P4E2_9CLOT|nr:hypothetical protein [Oceanirhabdus seepicola]MCM1991006.1 hypothetical protein [Oceanirhabdus seepicola]